MEQVSKVTENVDEVSAGKPIHQYSFCKTVSQYPQIEVSWKDA